MERATPDKASVPTMRLRGKWWGEGRRANMKGSKYSIYFSFYTTLTLYKNGYSHARRNVTHGIRKQTLFVVI